MPSAALIVPLPVNRFPNKLAPEVHNKIPKNHPFCSFSSFLIVSLTAIINQPDSSSDFNCFDNIIHFLI